MSFSSVPRPGAPASLRRRPNHPFYDGRRLAFVPSHDIDLVNLDLACQPHRGSLGDQAIAQLLGHGLHVRSVEAQFLGDLTVREVQAHEVQAHHPDPQRLVMSGQHRAGEVVKAPRAHLAPVSLPVRLGLVKAIADYGTAPAGRAADTLRPAMLAHQGEALGIVDQRREVDQIRRGHDATGSSCGTVRYPAPSHIITDRPRARYRAWGPSPRIPIRAKPVCSLVPRYLANGCRHVAFSRCGF